MQNHYSERQQALQLIAGQISLFRIIATAILCVSVLSTIIFFGYASMASMAVPLRVSIGMIAILIALWINNSYYAEMANRYQSLFEQLSRQSKVRVSLFVKRPISANVSAMWNRAETFFYISAIIASTLLTYAF